VGSKYKYKMVLLKLSGEALHGNDGYGINPEVLDDIASQLAEVAAANDGVRMGVVIGGGNIFRGQALGRTGSQSGHGRLYGYAGHGDQCPGAAGFL
jgi:uridylate kinase